MTVRVWPEARERFPPEDPPPVREPMVSEEAMWSTAPAVSDSVMAAASGSAVPPERVRLPAWIEVVPVKEFEAERTRVPEPFLERVLPVPWRAVAKVTVFAPVSILKAWLAVVAKRAERSFEMPVPYWSHPPENASVPELPRPLAWSSRVVPEESVVPPVKLLFAERASVPSPVLEIPPAPPTVPETVSVSAESTKKGGGIDGDGA